ncbi:MAG TPA: hypothetical protein HPP77_09720, partial [Candidatus Hydrogenedentes bacterium]|nr:hypothetical protein [Candidatus Hydrogenedentota bacterium]
MNSENGFDKHSELGIASALPTRTLSEIHARLAIAEGLEVERDEYLEYMTFAANKRPLFTELFGPLVGLKEEWRAQGASPEELDMSAFRYRRALPGRIPVCTGWFGGQQEEILEETLDYVIARDALGRTVKLFKRVASLALPLDYPVKTMDDWQRVKPHYTYCAERLAGNWRETAQAHAAAGRYLTVGIPGGFDEPRQLMGEERACMAF